MSIKPLLEQLQGQTNSPLNRLFPSHRESTSILFPTHGPGSVGAKPQEAVEALSDDSNLSLKVIIFSFKSSLFLG